MNIYVLIRKSWSKGRNPTQAKTFWILSGAQSRKRDIHQIPYSGFTKPPRTIIDSPWEAVVQIMFPVVIILTRCLNTYLHCRTSRRWELVVTHNNMDQVRCMEQCGKDPRHSATEESLRSVISSNEGKFWTWRPSNRSVSYYESKICRRNAWNSIRDTCLRHDISSEPSALRHGTLWCGTDGGPHICNRSVSHCCTHHHL